jgi:hypothetical protein
MDQDKFQLEFNGEKIDVRRHYIGAQVIFRIMFENKKPPLVVTRAQHANAHKFWTSIPEGRQKEAEEIGALISEYFKSIE